MAAARRHARAPTGAAAAPITTRSRRGPAWLLLLLPLLLSLLAAAASAAAAPPPAESRNSSAADAQPVRFFLDEGYFLEGDTEILRAYIAASRGRMAISGESSAAFLSVKGYYTPDAWDVYWTIRQACHLAYKHMAPHQRVNCIPGVSAMSLKRTFVSTWQQVYGEAAFAHIPRSYLIPQQYWTWRSHLLATGSPPDRKWVLKANIHRGKGVSVVPQHTALAQALTHNVEPDAQSGSGGGGDEGGGVHYLNVLVQDYLQQQLVIAGRSSYIRVWLLVTSVSPLRAYLFDGGFAIFGKQKKAPQGPKQGNAAARAKAGASGGGSSSSSSSSGDDLIVNLWIQDRNSSPIWSLKQLQRHLDAHPELVQPSGPAEDGAHPHHQRQQRQQRHGTQQGRRPHAAPGNASSSDSGSSVHAGRRRRMFADAWADMQASAALVLAAALPAMRAAAAEACAPPQGTFEYFGLDFVLDAQLRPWMLEVNAIPSMARRKKSDCAGEAATASCRLSGTGAGGGGGARAATDDFDEQKERFVHDMLALLGLPVDGPSPGGASSGAAAAAAAAAGAAKAGSVDIATLDAAGVLRMAAAAAADAGIRSAPSSSRSNSSSSGGAADAGQAGQQRAAAAATAAAGHRRRARQLLQGPPGPRAQQWAVPDEQEQWSRLQERRHWRQIAAELVEERDAAAAAARLPGSSSGDSDDASGSDNTDAAASGRAGAPDADGGDQAQQQRRQPPPAAAANFKGVAGLQWSGPAPAVGQLPAQLQRVLCEPGSSASASFGCVSCLTADDLAALAAAEQELQQAGRFVPVHDLIAAHALNWQAMAEAAAAAAAGSGSSTSSGSRSSSSVVVQRAAVAAGGGGGAAFLSQERGVWQRLYRAWRGLSKGGVGVRDLGVMRYYTTNATVAASAALQLNRQDYVMSAWLRARRRRDGGVGGGGGCTAAGQAAAECVGQRLRLLVSECHRE